MEYTIVLLIIIYYLVIVDASFGTTPINSITWNGNRFLAVGGGLIGGVNRTSKMSYSYDAKTWFSYVGPNPTSTIFTNSLKGSATNPNMSSMVGSVYVDSAFTLNDTINNNVTNKLDICTNSFMDSVTIKVNASIIKTYV